MSIPFDRIRRFGCQIAVTSDIVWFETCSCHEEMEEFQFFVVALGIEKAYQIVLEYRNIMQLALCQHMILEEGDQSQYQFSYIVKSHYGHPDYPSAARQRILLSGLKRSEVSLADHTKYLRLRSSLPTLPLVSVSRSAVGGRLLSDALLCSNSSPSPSPTSPASSQTAIDRSSRSSRSSSISGGLSDSSDSNGSSNRRRISVTAYSVATSRPHSQRPMIERRGWSLDTFTPPSSGRRMMLHQMGQSLASHSTSIEETETMNGAIVCCSEHAGREVEFFCEQCEELICHECTVDGGTHSNHDYRQ